MLKLPWNIDIFADDIVQIAFLLVALSAKYLEVGRISSSAITYRYNVVDLRFLRRIKNSSEIV